MHACHTQITISNKYTVTLSTEHKETDVVSDFCLYLMPLGVVVYETLLIFNICKNSHTQSPFCLKAFVICKYYTCLASAS